MAFTEDGLSNLEEVLERHVAKGSAPGLVALVAKGVETNVFSVGTMTLGGEMPVRRDTIFRIASMTKPITSVAAMMLVEEGKLTLDEPIDPLAPELANRRVLKRIDGPLDDTVPAKRAITLVKRHERLGGMLSYSIAPPPDSLLGQYARRARFAGIRAARC